MRRGNDDSACVRSARKGSVPCAGLFFYLPAKCGFVENRSLTPGLRNHRAGFRSIAAASATHRNSSGRMQFRQTPAPHAPHADSPMAPPSARSPKSAGKVPCRLIRFRFECAGNSHARWSTGARDGRRPFARMMAFFFASCGPLCGNYENCAAEPLGHGPRFPSKSARCN